MKISKASKQALANRSAELDLDYVGTEAVVEGWLESSPQSYDLEDLMNLAAEIYAMPVEIEVAR